MNEINTNPILSNESLNRYIKFEDKVPHFYLDGKSNVTIGIGCLIPNADEAAKLNMISKVTNLTVEAGYIIDEFKTVKLSLPDKPKSYYANITHFYLSDNDIISLFYSRLIDVKQTLTKQIVEFKTLPPSAQEVLIDMGFNLGVYNLLAKFPKFINAIRNKNFNVAASESQRGGIQESRNYWAFNTLDNLGKNESI